MTSQSQHPLATLTTASNAALDSAEAKLQASTQPHRITRTALWVLAIGLGGFLLWAAFAPLDEGVPAAGSVTIDTKRRPVQHLNGGIIKEVLVREGDVVEQGQVLVRMDEAMVRANYEQIRQRFLVLSAMQSRLKAEQSDASRIAFSAEVMQAAAKDPSIAQHITNQQQLFHVRQQALQADLQALQEAVDGTKAQLEANRQVLDQRKQQWASVREELSSIRDLVKDGYVPLNRQRELERTSSDLQAAIADLNGQSARQERQMAELGQRMLSRRAEFRKEVESALVDVSSQVQADAEKYAAEASNLQRVDIAAPAAGQVVGLSVPTSGAVIGPGHKLLDIVPTQQTLILEAAVAPHLIDKVEPGLLADIRFNNFAQAPHLVVRGKVISVSGDLLTPPQNPQAAHYLVRVEVTAEGLKTLGPRQLQPGMPAELIIKTGERSMLNYLLGPLLKRLSTSMKEA